MPGFWQMPEWSSSANIFQYCLLFSIKTMSDKGDWNGREKHVMQSDQGLLSLWTQSIKLYFFKMLCQTGTFCFKISFYGWFLS